MVLCVIVVCVAHLPMYPTLFIMCEHPGTNMLPFGDQTVVSCGKSPSVQMS